MEHVVFFTAADGSPAYRRTANLDDAVRVVEHLRNAEGREDVHVYSLAPVALNFRPYYRVEVGGVHEAPPAAVPPQAAPLSAPQSAPQSAPAPAQQPAPEPASAPAPMQVSEPMPVAHPSPFAEPVHAQQQPEPAMATAQQGDAGDDASNNGRGGRGLGFFTR